MAGPFIMFSEGFIYLKGSMTVIEGDRVEGDFPYVVVFLVCLQWLR